ncbi:MAG: hydroxyacylglutathione hydrolase [Zoogloeaceae bacterium]|jgi:hydroxyacylglutathione hydrolase|nr:hydroxyacylglutathione hydrolase [Zoogloeaceae bacterium]
MDIQALRAFEDNYIWLLRDDSRAGSGGGSRVIAVDPGEADPVLRYLAEARAELAAILVTHHHGDHTGGIGDLLARHAAPVFGPANEAIDVVTRPSREGDIIRLPGFAELQVLETPGHTHGHLAYYGDGALFCGDTLFGCGCGRLFEGTAEQMWASLNKLAALPGATDVFCAHEYTQSNIRFALAVEPDNAALRERAERAARLRAENRPTVPLTLAEEKATNPFLRCDQPAVIAAAERRHGKSLTNPAAVFVVLREWKNDFR